jgi:erythromycin esterase-like protein
VAQLVEHHLAKVGVAGSNPVVRSKLESLFLSIRCTGNRSEAVVFCSRRPGSPAVMNLAADEVRAEANPLDIDAPGGLDPLIEMAGGASVVLLGEASHGTHEFYAIRAELTRRLIDESGFVAVAAEADWPDALRVNRWVRGDSRDRDANEALADFRRFPAWMWRNRVVLEFVGWLREHNERLPDHQSKAGFYGLDLYGLQASRAGVIDYLSQVDREAAHRARERYSCFDPYREDLQDYGFSTPFGEPGSCEDEVLEQLLELQRSRREYAARDGRVAVDEAFFAEQNALVVRDAEAYYRAIYRGGAESWNLRDRHMADALEALRRHLAGQGEDPKVVVWAHNSHLGDARATEMGEAGELNLGQLIRERQGRNVATIGFTTFEGWVTAASSWGGPAERKRVRPGLPGSYEALFHDAGVGSMWLTLRPGTRLGRILEPLLERARGDLSAADRTP